MTATKGAPASPTPRMARKVAVIGATVLTVGVALIALPAPAFVVISVGLAILATEFLWARRLVRRVKQGGALNLRGRMAKREGEPPVMRTSRPLAFAIVAVVVCFSLSLAFSHIRLRPLENQVDEILQDSVPSVEHLSTARTELLRIGMYANEYVFQSSNGKTTSREDITAARNRLDSALVAHEALPSFPGEPEHDAEIARDLALMDEALRKALDGADEGHLAAAQLALHGAFHQWLVRADDVMQRVLAHNTEQTREATARILKARHEAVAIATLLGGVSVLVALVAGILAFLTLRTQARLLDAHGRLLAARATELEAFAGRVAHDLKTPLGAIALRLMVAQQGRDLDPKLRENFDKLRRQVDRMDHIIDGLLEFARAGANPPPGAHADLRVILDEVVAEARTSAESVNAEISVDAFAPTQLACTPAALTSVLSNMLGNAVKYIVEGQQVTRRIWVHVKDHNNSVRVEVKDTGPGLPPGSEQFVFEPFRRMTETRLPGIGLGLATVKKIVEAYNGRVGVHSKPGEGSSFWFEIPKVPANALPPPDASPVWRGQSPRGPSA